MPQQFSAKIYKLGINPCVDVPRRVSQAFGRTGYVAVVGALNGQPIRATLVPKGGGRHRLYINGAMRKRAGVDVGDRVTLVLSIDTRPRVVAMPAAFARALKRNRRARIALRKEILTYLNWVKRPETLQRNIKKVVATLLKS